MIKKYTIQSLNTIKFLFNFNKQKLTAKRAERMYNGGYINYYTYRKILKYLLVKFDYK